MEKKWADIKGFEGLYKVSNYGEVFSIRANKILKPYLNGGYLRIGLSKNGKRTAKMVHVLVAEAFIGEKPFDGAQVNHKDLDRQNNRADNLEWCSGSENVRHCLATAPGRIEKLAASMSEIGKKFGHIGAEAAKKPVMQIDAKSKKMIAVFPSAREAAKQTGASYKNISDVCTGKKKTHRGFVWAFADVEGATTIESAS